MTTCSSSPSSNEPVIPAGAAPLSATTAAATGRSAGEPAGPIDRPAAHRPAAHRPAAHRPATADPRSGDEGDRRPDSRTPEPVDGAVVRSDRLAVVALAVCAMAHFPPRYDGVPLGLHALAVGLSVCCAALALILVVRPGAVVLAGAVVVPAVLAVAHVHGGSLPSAALSRSVDLVLAPPWFAAPVAAAAALLALAALVVRVASARPAARRAPSPPPKTRRTAD
ncbi:hypothetical protein AB0420_01905 [Streptomyces caelestis]|uniref:hypothetical protein n=1 Tax=Streptomyces caelestis TaxID=36816 RepID=UPI00344B6655